MNTRQGASIITGKDFISTRSPEYMIVNSLLTGITTLPAIEQLNLVITLGNLLTTNNQNVISTTTREFNIQMVENTIQLLKSFLDRQLEIQQNILGGCPQSTIFTKMIGDVKYLSYQELIFLFALVARAIEDQPHINVLHPDKNVKSLGEDLYTKAVNFAKRFLKLPGIKRK